MSVSQRRGHNFPSRQIGKIPYLEEVKKFDIKKKKTELTEGDDFGVATIRSFVYTDEYAEHLDRF